MPLTQYALSIVTASVMLALIIELLRRRQLKEKYVALWLMVGVAVAVISIFPNVLAWLAGSANVAVPINLLFFLAILLLLGVTMHLSWESSRQEERSRVLAEEITLLRADLEALRARTTPPVTDTLRP